MFYYFSTSSVYVKTKINENEFSPSVPARLQKLTKTLYLLKMKRNTRAKF